MSCAPVAAASAAPAPCQHPARALCPQRHTGTPLGEFLSNMKGRLHPKSTLPGMRERRGGMDGHTRPNRVCLRTSRLHTGTREPVVGGTWGSAAALAYARSAVVHSRGASGGINAPRRDIWLCCALGAGVRPGRGHQWPIDQWPGRGPWAKGGTPAFQTRQKALGKALARLG